MNTARLISERDAASYLGVKPRSLKLARLRGTNGPGRLTAPRWVRVGKLVKYDLRDLDNYIDGLKGGNA